MLSAKSGDSDEKGARKRPRHPPADPVSVPPGADPRLRLLQVAESLAAIRTEHDPLPEPRADSSRRSWGVKSGLKALANRFARETAKHVRPSAITHSASVLVDAPLDVAWAQTHEPLADLIHVFHQEWHGMRAAAGYLPGSKVAVTIHQRLSLTDLERVVAVCDKQSRRTVVFHGWSDNFTLLARCLRETLGSSVRLVAVWHGNTAQFINPYEVKQLATVIDLAKGKVLDRLESVKPDLHLLDDRFNAEVLLNVGPSIREPRRRVTEVQAALVPIPLDWRKNLHTNVFACSAAGLKDVYVTADFEGTLPFELASELHQVPRPTRAELFALISNIDLVMNASLSECQPMTALEALAHRVPCITGPLSLRELDEHPLQRLVQVAGVDALGPLTKAIRAVAERAKSDAEELHDLLVDYEQALITQAFRRYERIAE